MTRCRLRSVQVAVNVKKIANYYCLIAELLASQKVYDLSKGIDVPFDFSTLTQTTNETTFLVERSQKHFKKALFLGMAFVACMSLLIFASSLTSMSDMRTRMVDGGRGLLCELGRHTSQNFNEPYFPTRRWYVDLSTGNTRELSKSDIVANGIRHPRSSIHWLLGVRQELILLRNDSSTSSESPLAMLPLMERDKIKELVLDRDDYSLRSTGGGEKFRIEWHERSQSSSIRVPIDLLMHAFVPPSSDCIVSFSSTGLAKVPNTQLRDVKDPTLIIAQWRQSPSCLPWCNLESIYTLSDDQKTIESRSLQTGELSESIPMTMPVGWSGAIYELDMNHRFIIGVGEYENVDIAKGTIVADFQTGNQIAHVPDTIPIDYAPASQCILLRPIKNSSASLQVLSVANRKIVDLDGVEDGNLAKIHLSTCEPRAVAVMRDGSIRNHSLPAGKLISNIDSMQNHKDVYLILAVVSCAFWIVCCVVIGRTSDWYESIDIAITVAVIWCSLVLLHRHTLTSIGLGAILSSFSIGASFAAAIVLIDWSRSNPAKGAIRFVRWIFTISILWEIFAIEVQDQLHFDACNVPEARICGIAFLAMCYLAGRTIDAWQRWRFPMSKMESGKSTQWSISLLLRCTTLMAILFALLIRSPGTVNIDWPWLGKLLLVLALPILIGTFCCSVWRNVFWQGGSFRTKTSTLSYWVLSSTAFFVVVSAIGTAFFSFRSLGRGFQWSEMSEIEYCFWYSVGFIFVFSTLLYRTLPKSRLIQKKGS